MLRSKRHAAKNRKTTSTLGKLPHARRMHAEVLERRNLLAVDLTGFEPTSAGSGYATSWDVDYQSATPSVAMDIKVYESADASGSTLGSLLTTYSFTPSSASGTAAVPAVLRE